LTWAAIALSAPHAFAQNDDLSSLPSYKAGNHQLGVIRIHGSQLSLRLIHLWEEGFLTLHTDIRYRDNVVRRLVRRQRGPGGDGSRCVASGPVEGMIGQDRLAWLSVAEANLGGFLPLNNLS